MFILMFRIFWKIPLLRQSGFMFYDSLFPKPDSTCRALCRIVCLQPHLIKLAAYLTHGHFVNNRQYRIVQ